MSEASRGSVSSLALAALKRTLSQLRASTPPVAIVGGVIITEHSDHTVLVLPEPCCCSVCSRFTRIMVNRFGESLCSGCDRVQLQQTTRELPFVVDAAVP